MTRDERTARPVLDPAALAALAETTGDDAAFLAELVDAFLADSPALLATIHDAVAEDDADRLRRAAHSLKSTSQVFGASNLAALCQELEQLGKLGIACDVAPTVALVDAAYARVEMAVMAIRPAT